MIDSTFTTPWLCFPFDLGADIVMHSATKFLSGHGVVIGGLLVDGGRFDWEASGRFPTLSEPYASFHDLNTAFLILLVQDIAAGLRAAQRA